MTLPLAGAKIRAADLATIFATNTDAWTPYTPTLTQSGAVTKTTVANYMKIGRLVVVEFFLTATGAGTANNAVLVGLPVAAATAGPCLGAGFIFDASANLIYNGSWTSVSTTTAGLFLQGAAGTTAGATGSGFTAALANTDQIRGAFMYQSAA